MAKSPSIAWLPDWLLKILLPLRDEMDFWLVGGAIRDKFLDRQSFDYDFTVVTNARKIARSIANTLGAAYFDLDSERDTGRVLFSDDQDQMFMLDFASLRGNSITEDLGARDFTINSLAVDLLLPDEIIDPTSGLLDIKDGILRATSSRSFLDDPIRILRAIRFAVLFDSRIDPQTLEWMRESVERFVVLSPERIRDEVFRIFSLPRPIRALRLIDHLNLTVHIFPELEALKGVTQSSPHEHDVWRHTLSVVDQLGSLLSVMAPIHNPEGASQLLLGEYSFRLGRFRSDLNKYLDAELSQGRKLRQLIYLGALYHDSGKPIVREEIGGKIQFHNHAEQGAKIISERAIAFRLSKGEVQWLARIVEGHLRPSLLSREAKITKRAVYRFIRDTGDVAPGILLLSLADILGKGDPPVDQISWGSHVKTVRELFAAFYAVDKQTTQQEPLLKGDELSSELGITPGPEIGRILVALKEAQALGEISSKSEALSLARKFRSGNQIDRD